MINRRQSVHKTSLDFCAEGGKVKCPIQTVTYVCVCVYRHVQSSAQTFRGSESGKIRKPHRTKAAAREPISWFGASAARTTATPSKLSAIGVGVARPTFSVHLVFPSPSFSFALQAERKIEKRTSDCERKQNKKKGWLCGIASPR